MTIPTELKSCLSKVDPSCSLKESKKVTFGLIVKAHNTTTDENGLNALHTISEMQLNQKEDTGFEKRMPRWRTYHPVRP